MASNLKLSKGNQQLLNECRQALQCGYISSALAKRLYKATNPAGPDHKVLRAAIMQSIGDTQSIGEQVEKVFFLTKALFLAQGSTERRIEDALLRADDRFANELYKKYYSLINNLSVDSSYKWRPRLQELHRLVFADFYHKMPEQQSLLENIAQAALAAVLTTLSENVQDSEPDSELDSELEAEDPMTQAEDPKTQQRVFPEKIRTNIPRSFSLFFPVESPYLTQLWLPKKIQSRISELKTEITALKAPACCALFAAKRPHLRRKKTKKLFMEKVNTLLEKRSRILSLAPGRGEADGAQPAVAGDFPESVASPENLSASVQSSERQVGVDVSSRRAVDGDGRGKLAVEGASGAGTAETHPETSDSLSSDDDATVQTNAEIIKEAVNETATDLTASSKDILNEVLAGVVSHRTRDLVTEMLGGKQALEELKQTIATLNAQPTESTPFFKR